MFNKSEKEIMENIQKVVLNLIKISKMDTIYRDLYLLRSREILSSIMPPEEYNNMVQKRNWLRQLFIKIDVAMKKNDWKTVKELSQRVLSLKRWEEENIHLIDTGYEVYENDKIDIDAFSPGLNHLAGIPYDDLFPLCDEVLRLLAELQKGDPTHKDFYFLRYNAFRSFSLKKRDIGSSQIDLLDEEGLRERAEQALVRGDMDLLEQISKSILKKEDNKGTGQRSEDSTFWAKGSHTDRVFQFKDETIANAHRLGLTNVHLDRSEEYESLFRYVFHPSVMKDPQEVSEMIAKTEKDFPSGVPDALKQHIKLYAIHTFLNSGGSRYFPDFVAEDCLVEVFPEPSEADNNLDSSLLSELGLKKRRGLSRKLIEHSLLQNGPGILSNRLGLEPETFRIVCIPPDIFMRLGQSYGWGRQEIWTHFDGYQPGPKGKFMALAGGDVRFGGIYDLVGIGREYTSDHVLVRFAVIQRKRMITW